MDDHLGTNLKLLCSHYRSIAEVCRKTVSYTHLTLPTNREV